MKYPAPDGYIIESSPILPVTHSCVAPIDLADGTYVSYETSSKFDNTLQQIKVERVVNDGILNIIITEQTQEQIQNYLQNLI
jgi:hypothetical protein